MVIKFFTYGDTFSSRKCGNFYLALLKKYYSFDLDKTENYFAFYFFGILVAKA